MAKNKFHSGRGGYRGGIKPNTPDHLKRETLSLRLPKYLLDEIRKRAGNRGIGRYLEDILMEHLGIEKPNGHETNSRKK